MNRTEWDDRIMQTEWDWRAEWDEQNEMNGMRWMEWDEQKQSEMTELRTNESHIPSHLVLQLLCTPKSRHQQTEHSKENVESSIGIECLRGRDFMRGKLIEESETNQMSVLSENWST